MPRKYEQPVRTCPTTEADMGLQVETVLSRPTRGRRQATEARRGARPLGHRLPRVTRLLALAIKFQDMVDSGEVRDYAELARLGYVTRARLTQIMNLLLLAPDIQEQLLSPNDMVLGLRERFVRGLCAQVQWTTQRQGWKALLAATTSGCVSERQ